MKPSKLLFFLLLCSILCWNPKFAQAQYAYSGLYQKTNSGRMNLRNVTWDKFMDSHKRFKAKGYQLLDVEAQHKGKGKNVGYWAVWIKKKENSRVRSIKGWDKFREENKKQFEGGYILVDIESFLDKQGERRYLGVYHSGNLSQRTRKYKSYQELIKACSEQKNQGFGLSEVEPFITKDKKAQFMAVFHKGIKSTVRRYASFEDFNAARKKLAKSSIHLVDYEKYKAEGKSWYVALTKAGGLSTVGWFGLNWDSFKAHRSFQGKHKKRYLVDIEVERKNGNNHAPPAHTAQLAETPDIYQHMKELNPLEKTREQKKEFEEMFCGPCAASNSFMYMAENNYPKFRVPVATLGNDKLQMQIKMVDMLADPGYMDTRNKNGTSTNRFVKGVANYASKAGYSIKKVDIYKIRPGSTSGLPSSVRSKAKYHTGFKVPPMNALKKGVTNQKAMVVLVWGHYKMRTDRKTKKRYLNRSGGHLVTVTGYGEKPDGTLDSKYIIVHDPSDSQPKTSKYIYPVDVTKMEPIPSNTKMVAMKEFEEDDKTTYELQSDDWGTVEGVKALENAYSESRRKKKRVPVFETLFVIEFN